MSERVWMGHPGHFIGGSDCRYHLNTYVNGYIVSTVGEYCPSTVYERGTFRARRGDDPPEPLGSGKESLYETVVFEATRREPDDMDAGFKSCCPWFQASGDCLDSRRYATADDAAAGHAEMLEKWEQYSRELEALSNS